MDLQRVTFVFLQLTADEGFELFVRKMIGCNFRNVRNQTVVEVRDHRPYLDGCADALPTLFARSQMVVHCEQIRFR
jgi:hypothetical protein